MAKTDNLGDFLFDIAEAIRKVRGEEGPIPAQDFAAKIREMTYSPGPSDPEPSGTYYTFNIVSNPNNISIGYTNKTGSTSTTGTVSNDFVLADSIVYIGDDADMSAGYYDISYEGLDELSDEYQDGVYTNYRYQVTGNVTITG